MEIMTMEEALAFLDDRPRSTANHSLDKIGELLRGFDNPQDKIKTIHVAGTNGKGSTSRMLASVFDKSYKTGLFTSPYIRKINENVSVNGTSISDKDFIRLMARLEDPVIDLDRRGLALTYFEVMTALMYIYFWEEKVDIAIIETGLGGLLDSTNIIKSPLASVITTISMDHVNVLGDTIEDIAYQKAGIIKDKCPVFIYPQPANVMEVFEKKASITNSPLYTFSKEEIEIKTQNENGSVFDFRDYKNVSIKLAGSHQVDNACLALMVADYFKEEFEISKSDILASLASTTNVGRLSMISTNPRVLVDGSHNKEAVDAMIEALATFKYDKLIVGFSVLMDKDYDYIISRLAQIADTLIVTRLDGYRSFEFESLARLTREKAPAVIAIEDKLKAYEYAKSIAESDDLVLWCGSLYLIADFINYEGAVANQ